jgi:EAL domain-containing protein (putative c-di-GMP-specific phosphodiesterase class I)/FixJ family two-component response regulator
MEQQSEGSQSTTQIVIVDDDQFQLKLLSHQLSMVGYKNVTAFDDGQTALNHMAGQVLDSTIVILDLNMPNMDGLEFLQKLQETKFNGALLLVSGEDERVVQSAEALASSYDLWVLGHLNKPVQQAQLQKYLKQLDAEKKKALVGEDQQLYEASRLKQAIETGELSNFYQPKVHLTTGELVGVEALVRWEHPEDGIILPDNFIDLAEENELIDSIAQQVLSNALKDSKAWKEDGINITVAVNISMYNLNTREFISYLEKELLTSGINPQDLILEVTESKLMKDYSLVLDMLTRLRLRRVNLSIDDFGTGHSSMTQLRDIPFNELKIDRGFVHSAYDNATLHGIFDGSIQLAKNLGIKTVAEGVENEADWGFLDGSGCDLAQGFFIGKPMRVDELREWKKSWAERYSKIAV